MNSDNVKKFKKYVESEILPAMVEIEKIDDKRRIHIQKLVYTNIVDRFDSMIDKSIIENINDETILTKATGEMNKPILESELVKILYNEGNTKAYLQEKLELALRNGILRERHCRKLSFLLSIYLPNEDVWNKPRVNHSTGDIYSEIKPQDNKIPYSICGYADWHYSRRNVIVHGSGGTDILQNDLGQLKKLFKVNPSKSMTLKLNAIKNVSNFYLKITELILSTI